MPRCQKGTRKNKKTGRCEKHMKNERKRCKNGTRKNKKTGLCESHSVNRTRTPRKQTPLENGLSEVEIDFIIKNTNSSNFEYELRPQLRRIKLNKKYKSCWGDKLVTLYDQALDRVECWRKHGSTGPI
jgi:hypothetical protein